MSARSRADTTPAPARLQAELALVQSLVRGALARRVSFRAELGRSTEAAETSRLDAREPSDDVELLLFELGLSEAVEAQFEQRLDEVEAELEGCCSTSSEPLTRLRSAFLLTRRELTIWMLCAAPQLDHRYGRLYGLIVDDLARSHASEALLQTLLSVGPHTHAAHKALLTEAAPLRARGLIQFAEDRRAFAWPTIYVPTFLIEYVLGVTGCCTTVPATDAKAVWPASWEDALAGFWDDTGRLAQEPLHLVGAAEDALELVARVSARAKLRQLTLDLRQVSSGSLRERAQQAAQAAVLASAALSVVLPRSSEGSASAADRSSVDNGWSLLEIRRDLAALAKLLPLCCIVEEVADPRVQSSRVLRLPRLESSDRRRLWTSALGGLSLGSRAEPRELPRGLSELPLGPSAIARVAREFAREPHASRDESALLARAHAALPALPARLATPVRSQFVWSDLILPEELRARLMQLCTLFTERDRVLHDWGFAAKLPYGRAISALFTGPPGTGKTMAASIVANQLGLLCYRVDLASLVSKYIGETEKNLAELFDLAERSHVVLLFDEADALFGKRTQTASANDRYANLETSYLLQRIESYSGLAILTTNLRQNIDAAFTRRLRLVVHFPFPAPEMRLRLWRSSLPPDAPLERGIDLALLAERIELAGGPIKNAVLTAACRASAEQRGIGMEDLLEACKQELRAAGQAVFQGDFAQKSNGAAR